MQTFNLFNWLLVLGAIVIAAIFDSETRRWIVAGFPPLPNPAQAIVWQSNTWGEALDRLNAAGYSIEWQNDRAFACSGTIVWQI